MYEKLLDEANENGLTVIEKYPFLSPRIRGLCCDDTIAISAQIDTEAERTVVLCEELTHALHSYGDILNDPRMEHRTRQQIFDRLIGVPRLLEAALSGCKGPWEFAEYFSVPEDFFLAAMTNYRERYGTMTKLKTEKGEFILSFDPTFRVRRVVSTRGKEGTRKRMVRKENAV
ncbi:MAG: ImmA/IrrE family metallo-endopeptidase [Clostridia bacterium]|nr:ImmA/IrrE family metallo-endopeptidase [Clostridia bacterium]